MVKIRCALLALVISFASFLHGMPSAQAQESLSEADRTAYNAVVAAVASGQVDEVVATLTTLSDSADPAMHRVVQERLPDAMVRSGRHQLLLDSLKSERLAGKVPPDYSPQYFHSCYVALTRGSIHSPEEYEAISRRLLAAIEQNKVPQSAGDTLRKISQAVRLRLVKSLCSRGDYDAAAVEMTPELQRTESGRKLDDHILLNRVSKSFASGEHSRCMSMLSSSDLLGRSTPPKQAMLRMLLLESAVAMQQPRIGLDQASAIGELLEATGLEIEAAAAALSVNLPRLGLRHAEALLQAKQLQASEETLKKYIAFVRDDSLNDEYRFLAARVAIAKIDFATAKQTLATIRDSAQPSDETFARAAWMLGEIAVMQRDFSGAVNHYRLACAEQAHGKWRGNALFQLARCYEHLGDSAGSIAAYRRYLDQTETGSQAEEANRRIAALETGIQSTAKGSLKR